MSKWKDTGAYAWELKLGFTLILVNDRILQRDEVDRLCSVTIVIEEDDNIITEEERFGCRIGNKWSSKHFESLKDAKAYAIYAAMQNLLKDLNKLNKARLELDNDE